MIDWSSFWGAFVGNFFDVAIIIMLVRMLKQFAQFKKEGKEDKWLK